MIATSTGEALSASNFLSRDFRPALERAGLPRVNFHSLRHTAATILASSNIPPGTVHRILGHANFAYRHGKEAANHRTGAQLRALVRGWWSPFGIRCFDLR